MSHTVSGYLMAIIRPEKKAHANGSEAVAVLTVLDVSTICHNYKSGHAIIIIIIIIIISSKTLQYK
jgi:hypothetical protein